LELSWSTFLLEIVNFLILVWILKRFLYKPVLEVINRRRRDIEATLAEAEAIRSKAHVTQEQYENRLAQWGEEKRAAHDELQQELSEERARLLAALRDSLEEQRKKARVVDERRLHELRRRDEELALGHGAHFVARLMERLRGPELEAKLLELVLHDLPSLLPEHLEALRNAHGETTKPIAVTSAYPLDAAQRGALQQSLGEALKTDQPACKFREDPELIAGLRVGVGPWVLRANLHDELQFFTETSHGAD